MALLFFFPPYQRITLVVAKIAMLLLAAGWKQAESVGSGPTHFEELQSRS